MKVSITEKTPVVREMEVEVDSERVEGAYVKAFNDALRHLALPGFRRGKVPAYMGRKHITNNMLNADVADALLPESYAQAVRENGLRPVCQPQISDVAVERGKELKFKVVVEVVPDVDIKDYKGLDITQERYEVTDNDVEQALERTRAGRAVLVAVEDRGAQEGDIAFVDFKSDENGAELENGKADNFPMELVPGHYVEGFLDNLYGMKPGENRDFEVDFPADYKSPMAGKHVHFHFEMHDLKRRELPELNDEFAKSVSEFATLDELKKHISEVMHKQVQDQANQRVAEKIYVKLGEQVGKELVPVGLAQYHTRLYVSRVMGNLADRKMNLEDALKANGRSMEDFQNQAFAIGFGEARMEIIVRAIAKRENVVVSDDEMEDIVANEAKAMGQSQSFVWRRMEDSGTVEVLRYSITRDKVSKLLAESANITYVAPKPEGEAEEQPAEDKPAEEPAAE